MSLLIEPKKPMGRLFSYAQRYKLHAILAVLSSVLNKILDLMPPVLVAWVIDTLQGQTPTWIRHFIGNANAWDTAVFLSFLSCVVFFFESVFQWSYQYLFMTLAQKLQHDLRLDTYEHLQKREIAFFEEHRTGETMSMLNDDVNQLETFLNNGFNKLIQLITLFFFAAWVLFETSWELSLVGLSPIPFVIWGSIFYQRLVAPKYKRVRETVGALASRLENNISGILVIKSFTAENYEHQRLAEVSLDYKNANYQAIKLNAIYVPLIRMAIVVGFAGVLLFGSYWILNDSKIISVGELVLFSMMVQRMLWPLTEMGTTLDQFERARASARRIFSLIDTPASIRDPENPKLLPNTMGQVEFDQVHFAYNSELPILKGLNFKIAAGERVGVAGPTGAGKSTLIKLMLRLYEVTKGRILFDGIDLRELKLETLRKNISLVSQDVYLFHGTIRENIAYGNVNAREEEIVNAAKLAELHSFVASLPERYESIVGERGIKLSGGQRQRLSIARAILKNAPLMILDEATSSVDTETERDIQRNLDKITQGRSAIIIAHRLSTIRNCDRIIVIKDGEIVEEGKHNYLVEKGGVYAELWNVQSGVI